MPSPLTERQSQALDHIRDHLRQQQKPPTFAELAGRLGLRSTNAVAKILDALTQKGYIERDPGIARGIRLVHEEADPFALDPAAPSLVVVSRTSSRAPEQLRSSPSALVAVDPKLFGPAVSADTCVVIRAGDDGMDRAGIRKGDFLVVEETDYQQIPFNTIVACLFDERPLARTLVSKSGRLRLRPENKSYSEEPFVPADPGCHIIGRVLGVMRRM